MKQLFIALILFSTVGIFAEDLFIPRLNESPLIDGKADEEVWGRSVNVPAFSRLNSRGVPAADATSVRMFHNGRSLFLFFRCVQNPETLMTNSPGDDKGVYFDDHVEVFISPNISGRPYWHFMVTPKGIRGDARVVEGSVDSTWKGDWKASAVKTSSGYDVEIELPFRMFTRPDSQAWRVLFARINKQGNPDRNAAGEISSFPALEGNTLHRPEHFALLNGMIIDADCFPLSPEDCTVRIAGTGELITGKLEVELQSILAVDKSALKIILVDMDGGLYELQTGRGKLEPGTHVLDFPFAVMRSGEYVVRLMNGSDQVCEWRRNIESGTYSSSLFFPRFRNYIFDSMNLSAVKIEIKSNIGDAPRQGTMRFADKDGKALGETHAFSLRESALLNLPVPARLDYGDYQAIISLGGEEQVVPIEKLKVPDGYPQIWFDENNNFVINGKPIFLFGGLYTFPSLEGFLDSDFNCVFDWYPAANRHYAPNGDFRRFEQENFYVVGRARGVIDRAFRVRQDIMCEKEMRETEKLFNENHKKIICWKVADEPEYFVTNKALYRTAFRWLASKSGRIPVWTNHNAISALDLDADLCDIVSMDPYLGFERNNPAPLVSYERIIDSIKAAVKSVGGRKPVWAILQAYPAGDGHAGWTSRFPTIQEFRLMTYLAVIHGARSTSFYREELLSAPGLWQAFKAYSTEVRFLSPWLLAPDKSEPLVSGQVHAIRREADGQTCFILVNIGPERADIALNTESIHSLYAVSEEFSVKCSGNTTRITVKPYSSLVLLSEKPPDMPLTEIMKNFKESDAWPTGFETPGNLCSFWRAKATPQPSSYSPWRPKNGGNNDSLIMDWRAGAPGNAFYQVDFESPSIVSRIAVTAEKPASAIRVYDGSDWVSVNIVKTEKYFEYWNDAHDRWEKSKNTPATRNRVFETIEHRIEPVNASKIRVYLNQLNELKAFEQ